MRRPVHPWADRLLPLEPLRDMVAFQVVASRQPQKLRMHGGQLLHQVGSQPVLAAEVGQREDRDQAQVEISGVAGNQLEVILRTDHRHRSRLSVILYCCQSPVMAATEPCASTVPVRSLTSRAVTGPVSPPSAFA